MGERSEMNAGKSTLVVIALVAVAIGGCLGGNTNTPSTSTPSTTSTPVTTSTPAPPTYASTVTLGTTDTITSLDPGDAYEYLSINVLQNTMSGLLSNKPDSATLQPELAATLPVISPDGLTYTFVLKPNLKYADGTPIVASDFLWALERNSGQVGGVEGGPAFLIYDSPGVDIANSSAVDATGTLIVKLKQPGVFFNSLVVFPNFAPIPKSEYTKAAWREPTGPTANLPVSSGPYQITEYKQGESITLKANPNYAGPRAAKTGTIVIKLFSTSAALKAALQNKEVDAAYRTFTPDEWTDLKTRAPTTGLTPYEAPGPSPARFIGFNTNATLQPLSANLNVRQAVAYAVDRAEISHVVFADTAAPLYSIVPTGFVGQQDSFKTKYGATPDLTKAEAALTAAGYSTSNKLAIDLWFNSDGHYGDTEADLATLIKSEIEKTGMVTVTLKSEPWASYKKQFRQGNYGMFLIGWFPDYLDSDDYLSPFLTVGGAKSFGTFYDNPTAVDLIKQEQKGPADSDRIAPIHQLQDIAANDVPMLPLFTGAQQAAALTSVSGVFLSPTQVFPYYTMQKTA
ncbi:MAG: ABC transporter substrate-binding protein [Thermoplasmatota archaeon]